jgi:hypothetical protein
MMPYRRAEVAIDGPVAVQIATIMVDDDDETAEIAVVATMTRPSAAASTSAPTRPRAVETAVGLGRGNPSAPSQSPKPVRIRGVPSPEAVNTHTRCVRGSTTIKSSCRLRRPDGGSTPRDIV